METVIEERGELKLYVPWQENDGTVVDAELFADLETLLGSRFGGFTKTMGDGTWTDESGVLQAEPVYVYTVLVPTDSRVVGQLRELCQTVREQWKQQEVWYTLSQIMLYRNKED